MNKPEYKLAGYVNAYFIDKHGKVTPAIDKKNLVLPNAKSIVARALAGVPFHVDNVRAYNSGTLLGFAEINAHYFPATNQVAFKALFEESEAVGVINQFHLNSSAGGNFSELGNILITKPNDVKLLVVWKITIINCTDSFIQELLPEEVSVGEELNLEIVGQGFRIMENGDYRIMENGDTRIITY